MTEWKLVNDPKNNKNIYIEQIQKMELSQINFCQFNLIVYHEKSYMVLPSGSQPSNVGRFAGYE
jgi:hypothetical protein